MILEAIYSGEFYPAEKIMPDSPRYKQALKACCELMEQLSERLSKEDYALVEELRTQTSIAQSIESESHFQYGFSSGLLLMYESCEQFQSSDSKQPCE